MNLPTDLPSEVAARAAQPGFDAVVDRARGARRRRRTTIASAVASAAVVAGLVWGLGPGQRTGDPEPATPSPSPTTKALTGEVDPRLPSDVKAVLRSRWLHTFGISGSGGGIATIWRACVPSGDGCRLALVTRLGDQVTGSMLDEGAPDLQEVPGGWMVSDATSTFLATPDGEQVPIIDPGGNVVPVEAGDVAVQTSAGLRLLRGTKLLPMPAPGGVEPTAAFVTPAGDLVVAGLTDTGGVQVSWSDDGVSSWSPGYLSRPGLADVSMVVMAGHHDDVAVVLLGDDPDGSIPVLDVAASHDAGRTWVRARGLEAFDGLADLSGLAVSDEGSTYFTTGSDGLVRMDAEGNVLATPLSSFDHSVFLVSHRICVATETGAVDRLQCSADDGTTWAPQSLPGFG